MTTFRPSTDRAAIVAPGFHWLPIDARTPRGQKLQLINRDAGVACYGTIGTEVHFWTHWAPLPTFADTDLHAGDAAQKNQTAKLMT